MSPLESTLERLELISRRGEGARRLDASEALVLLAHIRALSTDRAELAESLAETEAVITKHPREETR